MKITSKSRHQTKAENSSVTPNTTDDHNYLHKMSFSKVITQLKHERNSPTVQL